MERKIVVTKRFHKNTLQIFQHLLVNFSSKTAYLFLEKIEDRVELILKYPLIGKPSSKKKNVTSLLLTPHHILFYRYQNYTIEILCLFDMRKRPERKPY